MQRLIENWRTYLQEISDAERAHLDDVLDVPIEDYLFGHVFGETSYRLITPISVSVEADGEMGEITQMFDKQGWSIKWEEKGFPCSKVITKTWTGQDGKPNSKEVMERMKLTTLVIKMRDSISIEKFTRIFDQISAEENKTKKKKLIIKFNDVYKKWFGNTLTMIGINSDYPFQDVIKDYQEAHHFMAIAQMFKNSKRSMKQSYDKLQGFIDWLEVNTDDITANLESYRTKQYYMILSRHPIDVFRMSDHKKIQSCHSPPSSGYKGGLERYDQYNICALAEAHANGMIAYLVLEDEFKRAGIKPTQEEMDKFEDEEIFADPQRAVRGLNPVSRIRVKNMSYRHEDVLLNFAVPHAKVYGDKVPGFVEHLYSVISPSQEEQVKRLLKLEGDVLDYDKFTKYGGTYEDSGYEADMNILAFVNGFSDKNITGTGYVNHDEDLEQSLKDSFGDPKDAMRLRLDEIEEEYNMTDITIPLKIIPDFYIEGDAEFNYDITMRIRIFCYLDIDPKAGLDNRSLTLAIEDALEECAEPSLYNIPRPNNVAVSETSGNSGYNYELYLEWDLPQSAHKLMDVEGSIDIDEIEDMLDTAYYQGYPAPNLVHKFSTSNFVEDSIPAYIEKFLERYNYSVGTSYAIEEFHMYVEGNRDVMWESEVKDYDEDQFFGEVPFALEVVSDGLIDIYPYSEFMEEAGYKNIDEEIEFNPALAGLIMRVLDFEIKDYYRPLQVKVGYGNDFTAEDLKDDEGLAITISFSVDADASDRELQKLVDIKDDDYTEVVEAINKKAVERMKLMKEKYRKTKERELERQKQQQIKEMKKNNKIKIKIRK